MSRHHTDDVDAGAVSAATVGVLGTMTNLLAANSAQQNSQQYGSSPYTQQYHQQQQQQQQPEKRDYYPPVQPPQSQPTTPSRYEQNPILENEGSTLGNARASLTEKLTSWSAWARDGPVPLRLLCFFGGTAMFISGAFGILGKISSLSFFNAVIQAYMSVFGLVSMFLEFQCGITASCKANVERCAAFLTRMTGRGVYYLFLGFLALSQLGLFDIVIGSYVMLCGFACIIVGQTTARKLAQIRSALGHAASGEGANIAYVRAKFDEYDRDHKGALYAEELSALCADLGSHLTRNELAAVLGLLDTNRTGTVEYVEFERWWLGADQYV